MYFEVQKHFILCFKKNFTNNHIIVVTSPESGSGWLDVALVGTSVVKQSFLYRSTSTADFSTVFHSGASILLEGFKTAV
jgi:hypothetical protein